MNNLHLIVQNQFPDFIREDYPVFVEFVKAYYAWVEENSAGRLETLTNIDTTPESFVQYFRRELDTYGIFNESVSFNRLYLRKIKEIYSAKGSEQALVSVLKTVYNADTTVRYPNEQLLRASSGKWQQERFITVKRALGVLPQKLELFYVNYTYESVQVAITRYTIIDEDHIRLFFDSKNLIEIEENQLISLNNTNGNVVYQGKVIKSPAILSVIDGGSNWQLGQIIIVPNIGTELIPDSQKKNTIARVASVDEATGSIKRIEILDHGYPHNENQYITVSPYQNKPITSSFSLEETILGKDPDTGNLIKNYTISLADFTDGTTESVVGQIADRRVINFSSVAVNPVEDAQSSISIEQWLESRSTLQYVFNSVSNTKGKWLDDSGQISNQTIKLQDNFYYQQFSYDIESTVNSDQYKSIAKQLQPAGIKLFTTHNLVQELLITPFAETSYPFVRLDNSDISNAVELAVKHPVKLREDSLLGSFDDITGKDIIKPKEDSSTADESAIKLFSKLSADSATPSELYLNSFNKYREDASTTSDAQTRFTTKARNDSSTASESIRNKVDKYLTDSATASSPDTISVSIEIYNVEEYFAEDYVGIDKNLTIGV